LPYNPPWVCVAYCTVAALLGIGFGFHMRRELLITALAQTSPDDAPSPELSAALNDRLAIPLLWVSAALWLFLLWVMIEKPF